MKLKRLAILYLIMLVVSLLVHLWIYGTYFSYENISNTLFVIGIILLLPSVIALTHAYKVFQGFNYTVRTIMSNSFKAMYPRFSDFKKDKDVEIKSSLFLEMLIASASLVIVGMILAEVAMS